MRPDEPARCGEFGRLSLPAGPGTAMAVATMRVILR
jgi:hypothetical protein